MLTECFNIRVRFPRKPRKVADVATPPPQQSPFIISVIPLKDEVKNQCPPEVPKRRKPPRLRGNLRKEALLRALRNGESVEPDADAEFFERFSSIRLQYETSERKTIEEFQFQPDAIDGSLGDQIFPTIGGWNRRNFGARKLASEDAATIRRKVTIDDLYSEVLYAVVHSLRSDNQISGDVESEPLVSHLQQAFHIDNDKHQKLLISAKEKKAPPMVLNMEIVEAKGLHGKDVNGLSDPFCTIYISQKNKCNSSMKPETLTPVWREYFSFPVTNTQEESLSIEVWDYDPEESVSDKMKRFSEVKSTKGLRVLMKEIALTASTGKQQHDFLGWIKIPLKKIPLDGFDQWFPLEGRNGNGGKKNRGEILLRMVIGTEKEKKVAAQEYRHVLHLLLVHDLDEESVPPYQWAGQFKSKYSEYILRQLQWQGGLTPIDLDMGRWLVYSRVQCDHPLNLKIFPTLFENISTYLETQATDDEIRKFWVLSDKLIENFVNYLRNIHQSFLCNSDISSQVYHTLKTLGLLKDHLNSSKKNTQDLTSNVTADTIVQKVTNAITMGATEFFVNVVQVDDNAEETPVENMIKVGQLLIADLRKGHDIVNSCFKELLGVDYFDITYRIYDEKYCVVLQPVISSVCSNLRRLDIQEDGMSEDQDMSMGTSLFELYLAVRQFSDLSEYLLTPTDLHITGTFHNWFYASVAQWLDIAFCKAMNRIRKAVQIDNLKPVDQYVQRSSSAVDTANIFHQIQIFWNQLAWPEVEGSYTFVAKIMDDLCRCIICYGEMMCRKVEEMERKQQQSAKYEISDELCSAVNNIEYVGLEMKPISAKLGTEAILAELSTSKDERTGSQCRRTLETVMENAVENINNKIYEILEKVGAKMEPVIYRLLLEGAETTNLEAGVEKLMKYLDKSLIKIKNKTTPSGFDKLFAIIWENAAIALKELVRTNIDKRRPPSFFKQIHTMLQIMLDFFYPIKAAAEAVMKENEGIREIMHLVELHGALTPELIMKYQQGRYQHQTTLLPKLATYGMLTIRTHYCEDIQTLRIEILNARNLKPGDTNGLCDPYVKVHIVPDELYTAKLKQKTKVKKKTLFPLFDETFSIPMTPNEMSLGGLIRFGLKDHDLFGRNDFLGEVYFPLLSIPFTTSDTPLKDLPQTHFVLTKPTEWNTVSLQTLENRIWDKMAVDYVKKERTKIENLNGNNLNASSTT